MGCSCSRQTHHIREGGGAEGGSDAVEGVNSDHVISANGGGATRLSPTGNAAAAGVPLDGATSSYPHNRAGETSGDRRLSAERGSCGGASRLSASSGSKRDIHATYRIGAVLGSGSFGQVRSCVHKTTNEQFAVKIMSKEPPKDKRGSNHVDFALMFRNEVTILQSLSHKHVIQLHDFFEDRRYLYAVINKCDGGELFTHIVKRRRFRESETARLCVQMLEAIQYVHDCGIVHRDIKAENFLFADHSSSQPRLILIDFGMSTRVPEGRCLKQLCGSPHYVAPELIRRHYRFEVDMWAMGVVVYLMLYGKYPFEGEDQKAIVQGILNCYPDYTTRNFRVSPLAVNFISKLLTKSPAPRLTAAEALKHPWILYNTTATCQPEALPPGEYTLARKRSTRVSEAGAATTTDTKEHKDEEHGGTLSASTVPARPPLRSDDMGVMVADSRPTDNPMSPPAPPPLPPAAVPSAVQKAPTHSGYSHFENLQSGKEGPPKSEQTSAPLFSRAGGSRERTSSLELLEATLTPLMDPRDASVTPLPPLTPRSRGAVANANDEGAEGRSPSLQLLSGANTETGGRTGAASFRYGHSTDHGEHDTTKSEDNNHEGATFSNKHGGTEPHMDAPRNARPFVPEDDAYRLSSGSRNGSSTCHHPHHHRGQNECDGTPDSRCTTDNEKSNGLNQNKHRPFSSSKLLKEAAFSLSSSLKNNDASTVTDQRKTNELFVDQSTHGAERLEISRERKNLPNCLVRQKHDPSAALRSSDAPTQAGGEEGASSATPVAATFGIKRHYDRSSSLEYYAATDSSSSGSRPPLRPCRGRGASKGHPPPVRGGGTFGRLTTTPTLSSSKQPPLQEFPPGFRS